MSEVNFLAVLVAAVSAFVLGGLWYGPLFGKLWLREASVAQPSRHPAKVFGGAFVLSLIAAYAFAVVLGPAPALMPAIHYGLIAGAAWVATSFGINYLFAQRSLTLFLVDGGYHTLQFALYGLILGLWH